MAEEDHAGWLDSLRTYVADSSSLPTSLGVNPCCTVYTLGRYIAHKMVEEIRAQG